MITTDVLAPVVATVREIQQETQDTFTLTLETPEPFNFKPGQFNMLYIPGAGEAAVSISGDVTQPHELIHTIREVGNVTRGLVALKPGDQLGVRGPFGRPWPMDVVDGRDVLVIAGGIGLAPLRPAVLALSAKRAEIGRLTVIYGARSPEDMLYAREFLGWKDAFVARATVDTASPSWRGNMGVVTKLISPVDFDPTRVIAMICGPEIMMRFAIRSLSALGVEDDRIFLSMERNMKCAAGICGHCQYGNYFVCKDGPVFDYDQVRKLFGVKEV
ncbi:MAG: FAD/NAD(P)-binding protein [Acidobacteriota bacterium]|nr:FAD/NAD(P)-binding protein [Acidobacteriota bacterium]